MDDRNVEFTPSNEEEKNNETDGNGDYVNEDTNPIHFGTRLTRRAVVAAREGMKRWFNPDDQRPVGIGNVVYHAKD